LAIVSMARTEPATDDTHIPPAEGHGGTFGRLALAAYLLVTAAVVLAVVGWLGGPFVYVIDDAAIHLSIADHLAHDATWGVVAGQFESASSSPLWTTLVAAGLLVAGPAAAWVPLALNVVAGVVAIRLLASAPGVVRPGRGRPADVALTLVLVVPVLFLPGLAVVGMEHTLHVALVLAAVIGVHRWALERPGWAPGITYAAVALGALTRFETAFVAAGLAAGLLAVDRRTHRRRAAWLLVAAGAPIAAFGLVNRAAGGGWLPNSILAKGQGIGPGQRNALTADAVFDRLTADPVLVLLVAVAVAYLVVRGRRGPSTVPAVALLVATLLHVLMADVGWYERYQAYLIAIGVYLVLGMLVEVPGELRRRVTVGVVVLAALFSLGKASHIVDAPRAADDMYRQQYQAGEFLDRYYAGEPVATDQLGYISWFHDGPLTDFAGLGDYAVLRASEGRSRHELWAELARDRGFRVAVLYDRAALLNIPEGWILAGSWRIDNTPVTGVSRMLQFYATTPEEVERLQDHLRAYEDDLPARTELRLNEGAPLQALAIALEESEEDAGAEAETSAAPETDAETEMDADAEVDAEAGG
jgi:hypothetical protein